ncbi:MAG: hypothetical protein M3R10_01220 [Verrucomicrobiota bacterium]|nr:hypothetical protein [Verrucomicrobiota bacterium]
MFGLCPHTVEKFHRTVLVSVVLGATWLASIAFGMRILLNYDNGPGRTATVPKNFPAQSALVLATDRPTLVMLAHPRCPCTRASVGELAQIMAELQGQVKAYVVFAKPADSGPDWNDTDLWRSVAEIPGVTPVGDDGGLESRRFGAETSGHTLLFAADGRLLFSGGITQSRGHAGGNEGESAIVSLVKYQRAARAQTPVFGCSLVGAGTVGIKKVCLK